MPTKSQRFRKWFNSNFKVTIPPTDPRYIDPIEGAITPDIMCEMGCSETYYYPIDRLRVANAARTVSPYMPIGEENKGILVNGPQYIPQFIPTDKIRMKDGVPDYPVFDYGSLYRTCYGDSRFYPTCDQIIGNDGLVIQSQLRHIDNYRTVTLNVRPLWDDEVRRMDKLEEQKKKVFRNKVIVGSASISFLLGCVGLYYLGSYVIARFFSPTLAQSNLLTWNNTSGDSASTGNSTMMPSTTTTRKYPDLDLVERVPILALPKPTFDIVSIALELDIEATNTNLAYSSGKVTLVLNITSETNTIHLACAVDKFTYFLMTYPNGSAFDVKYKRDLQSQLLSITLPDAISTGSTTIEIDYTPSFDTDRIQVPCGSGKCLAYVPKQLRSLVPHFDYSIKHKWTVTVNHPAGVKVVTNTKAVEKNSSKTLTVFHETPLLSPNELSFVITHNFDKNKSGNQVEYYTTGETELEEVNDLVGKLDTALKSSSSSSSDTFFLVFIPDMENYLFYGLNVAFVGSNMGDKMAFAWRFIFRLVLHKKVTSSDKNPTWINENSAIFLATNYKSPNKQLWKMHFYKSAIESSRSGTKMPFNMKIAYEDEPKYFEKPAYVAKMSTALEMLTSIGTYLSEDVLTDLDKDRNGETSAYFFFLKSQKKLANGKTLDVDKFATCYIDSPEAPGVNVLRRNKTHVVIQRANGGEKTGSDMHLWYVKGSKYTNTPTKGYAFLSNDVTSIEVKSEYAVMLSGFYPYSAYKYTLEETEYDKLLDPYVLVSYDQPSIAFLAFNSFRAAAEGKLSYETLKRFMKFILIEKAVTVDSVVDLWMWTLHLTRTDKLRSLIMPMVAFVLNATGSPSDSTAVTSYFVDRCERSFKDAPRFEIENAVKLVKYCGGSCFELIESRHSDDFKCVTAASKNCSYNRHMMELLVCSQVRLHGETSYEIYDKLYASCTGKRCRLPVLRGLLCSQDRTKLEGWLKLTTTLNITEMLVERQVALEIFKGLASNDVSKSMLLPFLYDNWNLLQKKYAKFPALLGDIIDVLVSTIDQLRQLEQYEQFVAFYGERLNMYREFEDHTIRSLVEKARAFNQQLSPKFSILFL